ncbi:DNA-binding protein [Mycobacterium leprae Kyoto-2]|uniref:Possible DNA-binding protein n=4 Tax=Mycobacterium leprae TaxID=1769 RepID=Q9CBE1_MYCLE|nr:helicase-associated domain-containing protein [Mycobacterium leprae]CAR72253.1 possible DNA-binding protein [Mycobacterium leprae Br4923]AWV48489.1 DNA-binding protein [Mycobacterium leprae]OAR21340.1 DNA-binding protein [Mycobacterium leprae 3125609]OAX71524.1 DNA-binding protein [Mycobacterium leprae 7935681]CAC31111.1 possible DNA-binding protein [Mycobacterium leprae]
MTDNTPDIPLGSWLADLSDERLIQLLELRPDLAQPPPGSIAALAARAQARQSIKAATDELNFLQFAVIDALLVLQADSTPVPTTKLKALIGDRAPQADVVSALDNLRQRALAWGETTVRIAAAAAAALPWHPGQVTLEDISSTGEQIAELIARLSQTQRDVLQKLLEGSPLGRTRDAAPGAPPDRPVPQLLAMGLLRRIDADTVILPRRVGQVLRGEQSGPTQLTQPYPVVSVTTPNDADAEAAGAVIEALHELDVLLETLGSAPVYELRNGGLGVREFKRLAKATGINEPRLGLLLEVTAAAGLIASGIPDPEPATGDSPYWAPTVATDRFTAMPPAERWHLLASTWLDLQCRPALIGSRGPDAKSYGALSNSLYSTAAPLDRRLLLGMLAELPAGVGVEAAEASAALIWRRPRWARRLQPGPVADMLAEGHTMGLVGRGAISTPGRALLDEAIASADPAIAVAAMTRALPEPIDHFLVQADLTVVVPGPLQRNLAKELGTVATVESAGTAMVYRISEQSIRHALDIGKTRDWMHALFTNHSKTPVPQRLTYLINDVARRHGQLRIGMAASFVRCEDPALLTQTVAAAEELQLRALAPTVAVSPAPIAEVLVTLQSAGFAPAAEDSSGSIVDVRPRRARLPTPQHRRPYRPLQRPNLETLNAVIAVLRKVAATPFGGIRVDPTVTMSLLQRATKEKTTLVIGYLDAAGIATQRMVSPIAIRGGQLVAFDPGTGRLRDFVIHRITSVVSSDSQ